MAAAAMLGPNEFEEHLLMDDFDIDVLLDCEDIEMTPFLRSSKQLMSVIDNVIGCIDEKINFRRMQGRDDHMVPYMLPRVGDDIDKTRKVSVLY